MLVRAIKSYSSYEYDIDEDYDYDIKNEYNNQLVEFYKKKKEKKEKVKMKKQKEVNFNQHFNVQEIWNVKKNANIQMIALGMEDVETK